MGTIEENKKIWNNEYTWPIDGDEWSSAWGGSKSQWHAMIYPRIHKYIEQHNVFMLEIAPGYGRWTKFLKDFSTKLDIVDLSDNCINACQKRFEQDTNIEYHINDGKSLEMIQDDSLDFIFSMDSLVHVEIDVIEEYIRQIAKKLKINGVAFIHHSNLGEYEKEYELIKEIPQEYRPILLNKMFLSSIHWRALSVSAEKFNTILEKYNLQCISQEIVNWGTDGLLNDCFSIFTTKESKYARKNIIFKNTNFMQEASLIKNRSELYS